MVDGEVVEDPEDDDDDHVTTPEDDVETAEDDVETGNNTCCGCFNCTTGEDTEPVLIAFTVRNETNSNVRVDNLEDSDVSNDQHPPLPTVLDDVAAEDEDTGNLHKTTEREDKYLDDDFERHGKNIVTDLMDDLISEITKM